MIRLTVIALAVALSGCSSVLTATRDEPIDINAGTRTIGSTIDDQLIETRIKVNVSKSHIDLERASRIEVTSYNGVVLLAGQVPREELKGTAERAAKQVQKVKVVHNELKVGQPISLLARNNDALITASVKSRMLADANIPGRRIKVTTEAGSVYLLGLVTRQEADLAVQSVQQVGGVQRIVKLFEYID
ncbi:BON domain-containing protein [Halopseudomonas nanhaiensis]|uniref:BON domain-containing protein n=1 Tax=Halopseudomonas nanhaiensis TaxID=2830842 RepID=UPI001CC17CD3|nr:BON domain-containing protein [Halopseudomonas nanhaiensis]UAW98989.1 BON domain-containing protein [Halopseudomonas nanhaiensis]